MAESTQKTLLDAVARNVGAVLSLPSAGMLRHHKSRFLAACDEGVWIESAPQDHVLIDDLIARQNLAAISFKTGHTKASFAASIVRRECEYRINAETIVEALLIRCSGEVRVVQRRSDYRVRVNPDSGVSARVWRIAEKADLDRKPAAAQEIQGVLHDLSLGGFGLRAATMMPESAEPAAKLPPEKLKLLMDERLRVELTTSDQLLLIEGRVRHLPHKVETSGASAGAARVGVQFKLENNLEGRQSLATLTRIVGQLQREEARRMRLGLVNSSDDSSEPNRSSATRGDVAA